MVNFIRKHIEVELKNITSSELWKWWSAKDISYNKFSMRSPNTKMVQYYNNFKLGKKDGDAQMVIES